MDDLCRILLTVDNLGIGAAGEPLLQYKLLNHGIDSARLTVDAGIDLVMSVSRGREPAPIEVKTTARPIPAGGTGKPTLGGYFPTPAQPSDSPSSTCPPTAPGC